jgi:hypothetical protein
MDPFQESTGRSVRLAVVAFALLALLAIVAFASRSGLGHATHAQPTPGYVSYAFTAFLILFVLAIPVAAWAFFMQAREGGFQRKSFRSRLIQNLLTFLFITFLILAVLYIKRHHGHIFGNNTSGLQKAKDALNHHAPQKPANYEPHFQWLVFWISVAGLAAISAAYVIQRRRRKRRHAVPLPTPSVTEDLVATMSDAIDDLEAEPDARRAVIAAYARMEGVFARHGLRRKPSETPMEYLRRILLGLTARADAVSDLTSLFEQAKFSSHEIDGSMKQDAIGALREIRDDLQAAPA